MRLFFALWPNAATRARIARAAAAWPAVCDAHRVPTQNLHLTLAFVGEAPSDQVAVLQQIGAQQRAACCRIEFDAYEYWPDSRVLVTTASETPAALALLSSSLQETIALDLRRPLRSHVTLARKVVQAPVPQAMSPFSWSARSFSLVSSDTSGAHAVYTVVDTWPLLDEMRKS